MDDLISRQAVKELAHNQMREKYCGMALKKQRDFYIKLADSIIDLLPAVHPEPHWIPVTERLPEKHGAYIVCYSDFRHGIYYGRVIAVAWFDLGDTWLKYRYADNARAFPPKLHYVIAWMPLPEPYKGATE